MDVSYINITGMFYYLYCALEGFSRSIVHWGLPEGMREADIAIMLKIDRPKSKTSLYSASIQ